MVVSVVRCVLWSAHRHLCWETVPWAWGMATDSVCGVGSRSGIRWEGGVMTGNRHEGIRAFLSVLLAFVITCSGIPSEALSVVAEAGGAEPVPTQGDPVVEDTLPVDAEPSPQPTSSQPKEVSEPVVNDDKVVVNEEKAESKVVHVRLEPNCEGVNRVEDVDVTLDGNLWSLPKGAYAREGHEFVGWSTTVDGHDVADDPGTADVDESCAAIGVVEGQELEDLRFVSVETDADGVSHEVERDLSGYVTGDVLTLWAQWKPVEAPAAETEDAPVEEAMTGAEKGDEAIKGDASKSDAKAEDTGRPEAPKVSEDDVHEGVEPKVEPKESQAVKDVDANGAGAVKDEAGKIGDSGRLYEHRLIVGMGPTTMITAGVVLGRLDDAVLLGFEDEASLESAEALYKLTAEYVARDMALGVSEGEDVADVAMSAKDNPFVEASEANVLAGIPVTPQGVVVGLLDTGASEDKHVVESTSVMGDDVKDVNGHAGRMLDTMVKENENVRVMSVKVLDDAGHGTASSVYAGVMYAVDNGAKVINMSFAGPDNEGNAAIREAVGYALAHDVVVIAAAGNGGYDAGLVTPANVGGVFTVGAADKDGEVRDDSNRGECVDVYVEATSTSVAAAKVSGQVSLGLDGWRERVSEKLGVSVGEVVPGSNGTPDGEGVSAAADTTVYWGVSGSTLYLSASSGTNHTSSKALSQITVSSSVPWYSKRANITTVVIDGAFAPTSTAYWFYGCNQLATFTNWSNLDVSNVTTMRGMFYQCYGASFNPDVSSWDTSSVTNMETMFYGCRGASFNPDVSSWNTSKVTNMQGMFSNCYGAVFNPDVSSWDTSNVTSMQSMFRACSGAAFNPDVSSWDTSNVTSMSSMFESSNGAAFSPNVSGWNTSNVRSMYFMFNLCQGVAFTSLDVSAWDFSKITSTSGYLGLQNCNHLKELKVSATSKIAEVPEHWPQGLYSGTWGNADRNITGSTAANMVTTINAGNGAGTWEWELKGSAYAVLDANGLLTFFRSTNSYSAGANQTVTDIAGNSYTGQVYTGFEMANPYTYASEVPWYSQRLSIQGVTIANDQVIKPKGTVYWFYRCSNLASFSNAGNLDTSIVTNMESMFEDCSDALFNPDVSDWDVSNVTSIRYMFRNCSGAAFAPDVSTWDTSSVTNMAGLFYGCSSMVSPPSMGSWDTSSVTNLSLMFKNCSSLTSPPDTANWNTSNVIYMSEAFYNCSAMRVPPNTSTWNTSNVIYMYDMFHNCSAMTSSPDVSGWSTSNVTDMDSMFSGCSSMPSLDVSSWDCNQITNASYYLGLQGCTSLKQLTVSAGAKINTTFPEHSAQGCYKATWKNDSQSIVGSTAANMVTMINAGNGAGTWEWETVPAAYFDANGGSGSMEPLVLGSGVTAPVCTLTVPSGKRFVSWNTASDGSGVVYVVGDALPIGADITLYAQWELDPLAGTAYAVLDANGLLTFFRSTNTYSAGANQTVTDIAGNSYTGRVYTGFETSNPYTSASGVPWYSQRSSIQGVTIANGQVIKPKGIAYWFYGCSNLVSFSSAENLDTGNVTSMGNMFCGCRSLVNPPVTSSWDTGNVTDMEGMFYNCSSFTVPPVTSSWDTGNVTAMSYMFSGCSFLTTSPVTSSWDTSNVMNMGSMFSGCSRLVSLDVSSFDCSAVVSNGSMLSGCTSLKTLVVGANTKVAGLPEHAAQGDYGTTWKNDSQSITRSTAADMVTTINAGNGAGTWTWELAGYTVKLRAPVGLGVDDVVEMVPVTDDWSVPSSPFTYAHHDFVEWSGSDGKTYDSNDVIEANMFSSGDTLILTAVYEPHEYEGSDASVNFVVTMPSSVNYVLKADGTLVGPSNVRIENRNPFAVRVSSLDADALSPFDIVNEVGTSGTNVASVRMGPVGSQLNIADYLTKSDLPSGSAWEIAQMAGDVPGTLALATDGEARVVTDVTSLTGFASLNWYFKVAG